MMRHLESRHRKPVAVIYGVKAGLGGLGHCAASAITALADKDSDLRALGPGYSQPWSLPGGLPPVGWLHSPTSVPSWQAKYTWLRWRHGDLSFRRDRSLGRWAADQVREAHPDSCYLFTQVALETLQWARHEGVFTVVDNPNGHIRNFRQIYERESKRWCAGRFYGHPSQAMVDRVVEEYDLADRIRVYSEWGKRSMTNFGVPAHKIEIASQTINLDRFKPALQKPLSSGGPLRVCYVGSLDLRKGFVYLLKSVRALGAKHIDLRIVGATGDRNCARLFAREKEGLQVHCAPGDPVRTYQESEVFVLPTLEDGLALVGPEAMACGLPVIVTNQCGASECVVPDVNGWIVPAADVEALKAALEKAISRRRDLPEMGRQGRLAIEEYCGPARMERLASWFYSRGTQTCAGDDRSFARPGLCSQS